MTSKEGEIEVYLCPDVISSKPKQQTPIPPSDPLLADVLSTNSPYSPAQALLSSTNRPTPSTNCRRNLTFHTSPDSRQTSVKDPVFNSFNIETPSIKNENFVSFPQPSCSGTQFSDMPLDPLHLSPLNDSLRRIFDEPSTSQTENNSETIRLKHALISESEDFGLIGNRFSLTSYDQETAGRNFFIILFFLVFDTCTFVFTSFLLNKTMRRKTVRLFFFLYH